MAVIKTAAPAKVAHVPAATLKLVPSIRKDAAFILQTITDDHGADCGISARMLRYTLADAASAFGKRDASSMARGLVYLVVAYLNGTNGIDGLCKPLPKWLAQVMRDHFETIRPAQPTATDALLHVGAMLDRAEKVGAAPKVEKADGAEETTGTENPVNPLIPTHGTEAAAAVSAVFARREKQRAATAKRVRALRATVANQNETIAKLVEQVAMLKAQQESAKAQQESAKSKRTRKEAVPA